MADYNDIFKTTENQKWAKYALAVHITREGLIDFVKFHINQLKNDLVAKNSRTSAVPTCNSCSTAGVVPCPSKGTCDVIRGKCKFHTSPPTNCPNGICNNIQRDIEKEHRFHGPSWKNTNTNAWCTNAWEIAKCFMPPDGYLQKKSAEETDFNGIISVILNCVRFDNLLPGVSQPNSIFHQVGIYSNVFFLFLFYFLNF